MARSILGDPAACDHGELTLFVIDLHNLRQLRLRMKAIVLEDGALGFIELERSRLCAAAEERAVAVLAPDDPAIIEAVMKRPRADRRSAVRKSAHR
jgi:hypothetical protein